MFITTLSADITELKGKKFLQQGDVDMMLKRLLVFNFTSPSRFPSMSSRDAATASPISCCGTSQLLPLRWQMHPAKAVLTIAPFLLHRYAESWSVEEVLSFLHQISLGHLAPTFQENGVDGQMLCELTSAELVDNLGLKPLQARKVMSRLWA